MKIKKACELTSLTERAIRLYLARNFLSPQSIGGTLDFSAEDIARLQDIALLRQMDFSLEQIDAIIHQPDTIANVLRSRLDSVQEQLRHDIEVQRTLLSISDQPVHSLSELTQLLRSHHPKLPQPDFGRFDELDEEEHLQENAIAVQALFRQEQRKKWIHWLTGISAACLVLLTATLLFLGQTRLAGNISLGPFILQHFHPDGRTTILLTQPDTIARLGTDTLTVPCRNYLPALQEGELLERGSQLAVTLTNADLIRLGVSPLHSFQSPSADVRTAWLEWILQALFRDDPGDNAVLWLGEISGLRPLFP